MESWTRVIVEWVNCLGIAEPSIQDLQDLRNGAFYEKLVAQLSRGNEDTASPTKMTPGIKIVQQELVSKFIEAEYPEFTSSSDECHGAIPNELYIASLLLTECSQRVAFHRPMCSSLKNETQISIKKFLELVLPYGKSLTREIIAVAITELGDATPGVPPSTPKPSRPLREFFNSPAARSAQSQRFMNDRNRELRRLRAQLETEQFEKTDLIEDIRTQEERIKNLQIKLDEKSRELRALRNERLAPATPQSSSKKKRPSDSEERCRRELEQLENANSSLQWEIEKLRDEREELSRRLVSKDCLHEALRKKFDQGEKSAEALAIQLEIKNNELLDMRMNNEELREHIREIQRSSIGEQSFEMEAAISRARSPALLNSSEALSSIVDIQLQETREESAQLRAQLDSIADKLVILQSELEESKRQNDFFRGQTAEMETLRIDLRDVKTRLVESEATAGNLEGENLGLKEKVARIVADLEDKEKLLAFDKKHREALETNLSAANSRIREFEICRENDNFRINELETMIAGVKMECEGLRDLLAEREEKLSRVSEDRKILESNLQDGLIRLEESEICIDRERSKVAALEKMLDHAKRENGELENLIKSRQEMLNRVNGDKKILEYDLMEAKQKLGVSEASLESEISKVTELKSTVESVKEERTDLHNLLKSNEKKLAELIEDNKLLEMNLDEANKKLEISEDSLENEKSKVTELKSIVDSIKEESSNLQNLLKSSEKKLAELTEDNKLLESNLEESIKRFEKSEVSLENERYKFTALKSTVKSMNEESLNLQNLLKSTEKKLAELIVDKKSLELDLDESKKKFEKSESSLESERSKVAALKSAIAESSRECENVRNQLSSTVIQLSTAFATSQALESDLEATRKKLSASELNSNTQLLRITELESAISQSREESEDLENVLRSKEALLTGEKSRIADLESALSQGKRDVEDLRVTLQELKTALENERSGTARLSDIVSRSRETSKNLETLLQSKEECLEKSLQRESSLKAELECSRSRIQELELSLSSEYSRIAKLEMEISRSTEISDQFKAALSSTQSLLADTEITKNRLQSDLDRAREKIQEREEKISNLEKNFADLEGKNTQVLQEKVKIEECYRQAEEKVLRLEFKISEARVRIEELEESGSKEMETSKNLRSELGVQKIETDALRLRLEKTESREIETAASLETAEKRIAELTELGEEVEGQLTQEREKFSDIMAVKKILEGKLSSRARSLEDARERIAKLEKELEESEKNLRSQTSDNLASRKEVSELAKIKSQLEHELSEERSQSAVILSERNALEKELSSQVRSSADTNEKLRYTETELEQAENNLRMQSDAIAGLEREILELIERRSSLEKELDQERRKSSVIESEKDSLEEKLSLHVKSSTLLQELITRISSDLEESREKLQDQLVINELLEKEKFCQERHKEKLEMELAESREHLSAVQSEKEMLEVETSLYGRSNEDLGAQIIVLKAQLEADSKALREERETSATLKEKQEELNSLLEKMESQLAEDRDQLVLVEGRKTTLEKELSSLMSSRADLIEEMSALHNEVESSRKDIRSLIERNEDLERKALEASSRMEILRDFEFQSSQLSKDLASVTEECESLRSRVADLSVESDHRAEEITRARKQLEEVEREKDLLSDKLRESDKSSNERISSLEERLLVTESSLAEARLNERSKEEALTVLRAKREMLTEDKIESELRMKEVIANLQEVRKTQDGVLRAQENALAEKTRELEKASKQLLSLKTSLEARSGELDEERSKTQHLRTESSKLKEAVERKSKLVEELQEMLENERKSVEEWTQRWEMFDKNVEDIVRVSVTLKLRLKELWDSVCRACPEVADSREELELDESLGTTMVTDLVESFVNDARTIGNAVARLGESNENLRKGMAEMGEASRSLRLELNGLWDSVRKACPELARPKVETACLEEDPDRASSATWITGISVIESFAEDARTIGKAIAILSEANETLKEHLDGEKRTAKITATEAERKIVEVDERINKMESELEKRDRYVSLLVDRSKDLQALLSSVVSRRDEVDQELGVVTAKWGRVAEEARSVLTVESSACDELKHLRIKRTEIEEGLSDVSARHARGLKPLLKALCRIFLWSEAKLQGALIPTFVKNELSTGNELSEEQELLRMDIGDNVKVHADLDDLSEKIDRFSSLLESYEASLRDGVIKREASNEEKLQAQVEKISKERRDMKDKLDAVRARNAKLEKNMDELRNENKKLKSEASSVVSTDVVSVVSVVSPVVEVEKLERLTEKLEKEILRLRNENEELAKRESGVVDNEARMKEVHKEYGLKLEKIKQKMKTAYNDQIAKLNHEQDKAMKEKLETLRGQMEQQCRKYTEDIAKYKAHISDLSSQYWDVGEKLLAETQEKQAALRQLQQLKGQQQGAAVEANQHVAVSHSRQKTASLDRRDFGVDRAARESTSRQGYRAVEVIEEETTTFSTRRHSVKSIQAMGNAFNAEDEEGEVFDSVYLADLKEGRCAPVGPDYDRLSELRKRNSMFRPHLRSSYAVETHVQPITLNEDDIKNGVTGDDVFNDSLSQSLLPGQKPKKKDRTQTSYKRPGPPTPSKNGGRLSLQGNELKSPGSRILRERNVERRTTATPRGLKNLFGTSISKRQDENVAGTPKARRLSNIFRKQRTERN